MKELYEVGGSTNCTSEPEQVQALASTTTRLYGSVKMRRRITGSSRRIGSQQLLAVS
jgi:hypothetical protein